MCEIVSFNQRKAERALSGINKNLMRQGFPDILTMSGDIRPIPFIFGGEHYYIDQYDQCHVGKCGTRHYHKGEINGLR